MKTFKEFTLEGTMDQLNNFIDRVGSFVGGDWKLGDDSTFKENFVVLNYSGKDVNEASVFLWTKDIDKLKFRITNIVPMKKNRLNYDEYNEILVKCINECLIPCASACGLNNTVTSDEVGLNNYMSENSSEKLILFSMAANKSTGSSHPNDNERWNDFICQAYTDGSDGVMSVLGRWLVEEGWSDDKSSELQIEFEQGISLLAYYRDHHYE